MIRTSELPSVLRECNVIFQDRVRVALLTVLPGADRNLQLGLAAWNLTNIARVAEATGGRLFAKYDDDKNQWMFTLASSTKLTGLGEPVTYDGMHASIVNWDKLID